MFAGDIHFAYAKRKITPSSRSLDCSNIFSYFIALFAAQIYQFLVNKIIHCRMDQWCLLNILRKIKIYTRNRDYRYIQNWLLLLLLFNTYFHVQFEYAIYNINICCCCCCCNSNRMYFESPFYPYMFSVMWMLVVVLSFSYVYV